jgi:hypothetical protein
VKFVFFCCFHKEWRLRVLNIAGELCLQSTSYIALSNLREKVVVTLQESCTDWREAAAGQNGEKLHHIVNMWLGLEITPAEFRRIHRLGHISMPSSIDRMADASLQMKLDKV